MKLCKSNCTSVLSNVLSQQLLAAKSAENLQNKVVILTPILILLTHSSTSSIEFREALKVFIFPDKYYPELHEDNDAKATSSSMGPKMAGIVDIIIILSLLLSLLLLLLLSLLAPPDSLRGQLIELMTCLDPSIKRYASELLYVLCNEDKSEFVNRTGFGNAIHILQLKGILK